MNIDHKLQISKDYFGAQNYEYITNEVIAKNKEEKNESDTRRI